MLVVKPTTYKTWLRRTHKGEVIKRPGRKIRLPEKIIQLIAWLIKENPAWGLLIIIGELRKLGVRVSRMTVRRVCKEYQLPPPGRGRKFPVVEWRKFIRCNMESIVACDFFTKNVLTLRGVFPAFSLVFIHYGTRRVFVSTATLNPDEVWMQQQVRNVAMWLDDEGIKMKHFIRDRDGKFPKSFDQFLQQIINRNTPKGERKGKVIKTAFRCPNQNAFAECWIGRFKQECLNYYVCFSLSQLNYIVARYMDFHNEQRPHQGLGNKPLAKGYQEPEKLAPENVKCKRILGGLLKHYYLEDDQNNQAA